MVSLVEGERSLCVGRREEVVPAKGESVHFEKGTVPFEEGEMRCEKVRREWILCWKVEEEIGNGVPKRRNPSFGQEL